MIEKIEYNDVCFALVLRSAYNTEGISFITRPDDSLQLGVLIHKSGFRVKPHIHLDSPRTIEKVQEVLHVIKGKVRAMFFEQKDVEVASTILNSGDTIILLTGAHGFDIQEDSKIIEIKQGPYRGIDQDKKHL